MLDCRDQLAAGTIGEHRLASGAGPFCARLPVRLERGSASNAIEV
jgi:hypothetical protein